MTNVVKTTFGAAAALFCLGGVAAADGPLGLNLKGSFSEGGFERTQYVPPIGNPVFNESPFITTEARPFYAYHSIPEDFLTDGGHANVVGFQVRVALTDRLAFLATTDGYTWLNFDAALPDDNGFNDIAVGFKYAAINDPAAGLIVTPGIRYTAPIGSLSSGGLDFNGHDSGYLNPFVTGAKIWGQTQVQAMIGAQVALGDTGTTNFLASATASYEILPGLYPMLEANLFAPLDGGDQVANSNLTGLDILDLGSSDPETVLTLGGGFRYRAMDNLLVGVAADYNVLQDEDHAYDWRITTDLVIHF
ncbi:MAG: hypothetical protein ACPGVA_15730 [Pikeienuella sp.]